MDTWPHEHPTIMNIIHPFQTHALRRAEDLPPAALPFDPSLLVQLVREQYPTKPHWAVAFQWCNRHWPESDLYTHFLPPEEQRFGSRDRWFYAGCFFLRHPQWGTLVVDVLHSTRNGEGPVRIGGIEFYDRALASPHGAGLAPNDPALQWMTWYVERGYAA